MLRNRMADLPLAGSCKIRCNHSEAKMHMAESEITALRLRIEGLVQGVGYRAFAVAEARALGLKGWVRNCSDGTVEALVSGPVAAVGVSVTACARGPFGAKVSRIDRSKAEPAMEPGFQVRQTI